MKRLIFSMTGLAAATFAASALTIAVSPGQLADSRTKLATTRDNSLVLTGSASASDLEILKSMSTTVNTLDMSGLTLENNAVPKSMLLGQLNLTKVTLPAGVTSIGDYAFAGSGITSIQVPANVSAVGNYAFADCSALTEVTVNGTAKPSVGTYLFRNCPVLVKVQGINYLAEIPEGMFDGCSSFDASIPEFGNVTKIGAYAFRSSGITSANLELVTSVGDYAFAETNQLGEVLINLDHTPTFGTGVFFNNTAFATVPSLGDEIPTLGMAHVKGNDRLKVTASHVGEAAYANNSSVKIIEFTSALRKIDAHAFRNLTSLEEVDVTPLKSDIPEVDPEAFSGLLNDNGRYNVTLHVADDTNDDWQQHPVWSLFKISNTSSTGATTINTPDTDIRISRIADAVNLQSNHTIDFVGIYSLDGMTLHESNPGLESVAVEGIDNDGVVIVKAISDGHVKIVKLK